MILTGRKMTGAFEIVILKGCAQCGLGFMACKKNQRWCSNACRTKAYQQRKAMTQKLIAEELFRRAEMKL